MSIRSFLTNLRNKIDTNALKEPVRFVTGNQSADLDSVISAISYSYFNNVKDSSYVIPLINIPREHLKFRRDILYLLNSYSINEELLYFTEDFKSLSESTKNTELILVDHCNIQGEIIKDAFVAEKSNVVGIVDHHQDEGVFLDAEPRIIQTCGSCSSLVFKYWYEKFDKNEKLFEGEKSDIIQLLLAPLLIDTSNMTSKVENGDVKAIEIYKNILLNQDIRTSSSSVRILNNNEDLEKNINQFYKELKQAKKDLEGFSFLDILHKDYKQFKFGEDIKVGFSSVGKSTKWIFKNFTAMDISIALNKMLADLGLDLLVFTTSYTDKKTAIFTREFCYFYKSDNVYSGIFDSLNKSTSPELQLTPQSYKKKDTLDTLLTINSDRNILKIFSQGNTNASRKQIVPIVKQVLNN